MHYLTRPAFIVAMLLGASLTIAQGQIVTNSLVNTRVMTGSISGRITVNGKGASGVVVTLRLLHAKSPRPDFLKIKTDEDGRFRFNGLAAGQYAVLPFTLALVNPIMGLMGETHRLVGAPGSRRA
jgi:hypothetical protein